MKQTQSPQLKYRNCAVKYQTVEEYVLQTPIKPVISIDCETIKLDTHGLMTIAPYHVWDGASGPTFDSKSSIVASLFHDAGYKLMAMGYLAFTFKHDIDAFFRELLIADGMQLIRANVWHGGVDTFGSAYLSQPRDLVLEAPTPTAEEIELAKIANPTFPAGSTGADS